MTVHLEPPPIMIDPMTALHQRNAELERQLAECWVARQSLQDQVDILITERIQAQTERELYSHIARLGPAYAGSRHSGDLATVLIASAIEKAAETCNVVRAGHGTSAYMQAYR